MFYPSILEGPNSNYVVSALCRYETTMSVHLPLELTAINNVTRKTGIHIPHIISICP